MTILGLIITLAIFGFVLYLINTYIPMAAPIKNVINVIATLFLILWLLNALGGLSFFNQRLRF